MTTTIQMIQLEPAAQAFAEATANPPFPFQLPLIDARAVLTDAQSGTISKPDVLIEEHMISGGPDGEVSIRILRPRNVPATLPVLLYVHGGGWVLGDSFSHDRLIRELAVGAETAVVFVNYTRSPEAKYPFALEECYTTLKWISEKGQENGLDSERIAVGGDSAGGNIAVALTLLAKERGSPVIRLQLLLYPVTNASFDTGSYQQFAQGYFLRRDGMMWFWDQYVPTLEQREEVTASPLRAGIDELRNLPPALVITAEADVLRDEGEAYANKLRQAGVPVTATRFQATIHDFMMLNALADTQATRGAITLATAWLKDGFTR